MLWRKFNDLTLCISYNINFLHDKAHGVKNLYKQYIILEEIGRGGFGIVYKAERKTDSLSVAVKYVDHRHVRKWSIKRRKLIPTEICLLELCREAPGVVQIIDWFASSKGFAIIMERPQNCMDLFDLVSVYGALDEEVARSIFSQVLTTVHTLYNKYGIFHRDIKDENIIIDMQTGRTILVDFGAAAILPKSNRKEFQGTKSYCPPEWFKTLTYLPLEATAWSLGVMLYVMVTGYLPFHNEIQICLGRFTIPKQVSKNCIDLLRRCLTVLPERRVKLDELVQHIWLTESTVSFSEQFKFILDKKLNIKVAKANQQFDHRRHRTRIKVRTDCENNPLSDLETDLCESVRRATSVNMNSKSNKKFMQMAQWKLIETADIENDSRCEHRSRCESVYDNVSSSIDSNEQFKADKSENITDLQNNYDEPVTSDSSTTVFYSALETFLNSESRASIDIISQQNELSNSERSSSFNSLPEITAIPQEFIHYSYQSIKTVPPITKKEEIDHIPLDIVPFSK